MNEKQKTKLRKAINSNSNSVEINAIFEDIKKEDLLQDANSVVKELREERNVDHDDHEDDLENQGFFNKNLSPSMDKDMIAIHKKMNQDWEAFKNKSYNKLKSFQDSFLVDKKKAYSDFFGPVKYSCQYDDDIDLLNRQNAFREGFQSGLDKAHEFFNKSKSGKND
jgi:hypothetical protein